jgi:hypothetical protein
LKTFSRSPSTGGLNFEGNFDYSYEGVIACVKRGVSVIDYPRALCLGHSRDRLAGQR